MELLAERYWEDGKAQESTRVYKQIIADNMASPRVCEWQSKVLRNALSLPSYDKALVTQELERLGTVYEKAPPTKREQAAECRASFHDAARELALVWHREAQKTQAPETYELAERAYRPVPRPASATTSRPTRCASTGASCCGCCGAGRTPPSSTREVVESQPGGKYPREAAFAAVLAWKNANMVDDEARRQELDRGRERLSGGLACGKVAPRPIPDSQQKMIAAFHTYAKQVPDARRAAGDDLPRGVHLLRPQPSSTAPSRCFSRSFRSTRSTSWRCSPPTCSSTR